MIKISRMLGVVQLLRNRTLSVMPVMARGREADPKGGIQRRMTPHEYNRMVKKGSKKAMFTPKTKDPFWVPPEHPSDVKREYLFENTRNRSKWLRTKVAYRQPPEQKYKKFNLILGHVQRRIAKNRVEVLVQDAEYSYITHDFFHEHALIVVKDSGETRIGDYISADKVNENSQIFTHHLRDVIRTSGYTKCPITGHLIRDNRLVDPADEQEEENEDIFDRTKILKMHDDLGKFIIPLYVTDKYTFFSDRRVHNYKYRDDFNRDNITYELRWKDSDIARSTAEVGSPERAQRFEAVKSKRSRKIDELRKQILIQPKTPIIVTEPEK